MHVKKVRLVSTTPRLKAGAPDAGEKKGGETFGEPPSLVCKITIPALIRFLEFARENLSQLPDEIGDVALHILASDISDHKGTVTIWNYDELVSGSKKYASSKNGGSQADSQHRPNEGLGMETLGTATRQPSVLWRFSAEFPQDVVNTFAAETMDEFKEALTYREWASMVRDKVPEEYSSRKDVFLRKVYTFLTTMYKQKNTRKYMQLTSDEIERKFSDIIEAFVKGAPAHGWYSSVSRFLEEVFPDRKDREIVAALLSATSPRVSLLKNIRKFIKAYEAYILGKEYEDELPMVSVTYRRILSDGLSGVLGQKTKNFARALLGDKNVVVVDTWISQLLYPVVFGKPMKNPDLSRSEYTAIENFIRKFAKYIGSNPVDVNVDDLASRPELLAKLSTGGSISPAEIQEILWEGSRRSVPKNPSYSKEEKKIGPKDYYTHTLKKEIQRRYQDSELPEESRNVWEPIVKNLEKLNILSSGHRSRHFPVRHNTGYNRVQVKMRH